MAATSIGAEASQHLGIARPRSRRRRLTVPRDIPLAIPTVTASPAVHEQADSYERDPPPDEGDLTEPPVALEDPRGPRATRSSPESTATHVAPTLLEPTTADKEADVAEPTSFDSLENAVARTQVARAELAAAESALDVAIAAAREDGLSWRSIGRATGLGHREAAARWGPPGGAPSL